jgi:hypothetical protein
VKRAETGKSSPEELESSQRYFLGLFTARSWTEFKANGAQVMGFNEKKVTAAARLRPGDRLLCYLTKRSTFVAVLEVTGPSYQDSTPIWADGLFPVRLPVKVILELSPLAGLPVHLLLGKLSFLPGIVMPKNWTVHVRSSPRPWKAEDGLAVLLALQERIDRSTAPLAPDLPGQKVDTSMIEANRKRPKFGTDSRVGRLLSRADNLRGERATKLMEGAKTILSFNKVTGHSVNFPISETCRPTAVCLKTCYFAKGPNSWPDSLSHQYQIYAAAKADPVGFAERVAWECDQAQVSFLRWNGGGDLFQESLAAIEELATIRPNLPIWVVTRTPDLAAKVVGRPNVFVHFSLDRSSMARREQFLKARPKSSNFFFSYQCEADELPANEVLSEVSVLFFNDYKFISDPKMLPAAIVCPLNGSSDISGACESCRRCFDGAAVSHSKKIQSSKAQKQHAP